MVVKLKVVVDDRVVNVVRLEEMFDRARAFLRAFFDVVDGRCGKLYAADGGKGEE